MNTQNEITAIFSNAGFGISAAGQWATIAGKREWVAFLATAEGAGPHTRLTAKRRTWHVTASVYRAEPVQVMVSKRDCFRAEAAAEALAGLVEYLEAPAKGVAQ